MRFRLRIESAHLNGQAVSLPPHILLGWYAGFGTRNAKSLPVESTDPSELNLALQRQPQNLRAGERWQMTSQNAIGRAGWDVFRATGGAHLMSISRFA